MVKRTYEEALARSQARDRKDAYLAQARAPQWGVSEERFWQLVKQGCRDCGQTFSAGSRMYPLRFMDGGEIVALRCRHCRRDLGLDL